MVFNLRDASSAAEIKKKCDSFEYMMYLTLLL